MSIEERIAKLEMSNRRLKLFLTTLCLALVCGVGLGVTVMDQEAFRVNVNGKGWGTLSYVPGQGGTIVLKGEDKAQLALTPSGIMVVDANGHIRMALGITGPDEVAAAKAKGRDIPVVGEFTIYDENGHEVRSVK